MDIDAYASGDASFSYENLMVFDVSLTSNLDQADRKRFNGILSRAFLKDRDLLALGKQDKEKDDLMNSIALLQDKMEDCEVTDNSSQSGCTMEVEGNIKGDPYHDIPKQFSSTRKDLDANLKSRHKRKARQQQREVAKTFNEYWEAASQFLIYKTWLLDYGDIMAKEGRESLIQTVAESEPFGLIDKHLSIEENESYLGLTKKNEGCPTTSYDEIFGFHSELVKKQAELDFMHFHALRLSHKSRTFLLKIEKLGFVPGYNDSSFPVPINTKQGPSSLFEEMETCAKNYVFSDVAYVSSPLQLHTSVSGKCETEKEEELVEEHEATESSCGVGICSGSEISFNFDPIEEKHLIASEARELYQNDPEIRKYFVQRYRLFSLLDRGIIMDREGWFSVTPERVAQQIAQRIVNSSTTVVVDAFAGVGGNSIQFALSGAHDYLEQNIDNLAGFSVIAIDMDPVRLKCARQNARVYGVEQHISFICADFFDFAARWRNEKSPMVDAIFLSPPWGGPNYSKTKEFDLTIGVVPNGIDIFNAAVRISPNIAYFLPRNTKMNQLLELSAATGGRVNIEQAALNNKIKCITAYYGNLVDPNAAE